KIDVCLRRAPAEDGNIGAGRQVYSYEAVFAFFLVVLFQETPDLVRLYSHDGVLLRVELGTPIVNFDADQILVQLVAIAEKGLFRNKLKKPALLWRGGKVFAFEN